MVCDEEGQQVIELIFVDMTTTPDEIVSNCVPVVHSDEEVEQGLSSLHVAAIQDVEGVSTSSEPSIS
jgi:hypothetical protein